MTGRESRVRYWTNRLRSTTGEFQHVKPETIKIKENPQMREPARFLSRLETMSWVRSVGAGLRIFRQRSALLPLLLVKPRLLHLWLSTARKAQVWFGVVLFLLVFVAPPVLSALSDYLYPLITSERKILVIFARSEIFSNPLRDPRYLQFMAALWTIGLGSVLILFINQIPAAIRIGRQRAIVLSRKAERIALDDPKESARLRQDAQGLLIDVTPQGIEPASDGQVSDIPTQPTMLRFGEISQGRILVSFFAELRRRNVFKVGAAYAMVAWSLIEIADVVLPALRAPEWTISFVTVALMIGYPITLIIAWAFDAPAEDDSAAQLKEPQA